MPGADDALRCRRRGPRSRPDVVDELAVDVLDGDEGEGPGVLGHEPHRRLRALADLHERVGARVHGGRLGPAQALAQLGGEVAEHRSFVSNTSRRAPWRRRPHGRCRRSESRRSPARRTGAPRPRAAAPCARPLAGQSSFGDRTRCAPKQPPHRRSMSGATLAHADAGVPHGPSGSRTANEARSGRTRPCSSTCRSASTATPASATAHRSSGDLRRRWDGRHHHPGALPRVRQVPRSLACRWHPPRPRLETLARRTAGAARRTTIRAGRWPQARCWRAARVHGHKVRTRCRAWPGRWLPTGFRRRAPRPARARHRHRGRALDTPSADWSAVVEARPARASATGSVNGGRVVELPARRWGDCCARGSATRHDDLAGIAALNAVVEAAGSDGRPRRRGDRRAEVFPGDRLRHRRSRQHAEDGQRPRYTAAQPGARS